VNSFAQIVNKKDTLVDQNRTLNLNCSNFQKLIILINITKFLGLNLEAPIGDLSHGRYNVDLETFGTYVENVLYKLSKVHDLEDQIDHVYDIFCILASRWYSIPYGQDQRELSNLCPDGTPMEFSVCMSDRPEGLRYVIDNADIWMNTYERLRTVKQTIPKVLEHLGMNSLKKQIDQLFGIFFPKRTWFPDRSLFLVWHGITHYKHHTLVKLYFNIRWKSPKATKNCINTIKGNYKLKQVDYADPISFWSVCDSKPAAICMEFEESHAKFVKIYYLINDMSRPRIMNLLSSVQLIEFLGDFLEFDKSVLNKNLYMRPAILMVRYPITEQDSFAIKFSFYSTLYSISDRDFYNNISKFARSYKYDISQYRETLEVLTDRRISSTNMSCHSNIGITFTASHEPTITTYMKPTFW
jgi:hypothetical protein